MRKVLSFVMAFAVAMALAAPVFASGVPAAASTAVVKHNLMLYHKTMDDDDRRWPSTPFTAVPGYGGYIRFWHKNETDHAVWVLLYQGDFGSREAVSSIMVPANSQDSGVYYSGTASPGTFRIEIVAPGGKVHGEAAAAQYSFNPNTGTADPVAPEFASEVPVVTPAGMTVKEENGGLNLYRKGVDDNDSLWPSNSIAAVSGRGNYISYSYKNESDHGVWVFLCRTDSGSREIVSSMSVPAYSQNSEVYFSAAADSGTYRIEVEAPGRRILGEVSVSQYTYNPN